MVPAPVVFPEVSVFSPPRIPLEFRLLLPSRIGVLLCKTGVSPELRFLFNFIPHLSALEASPVLSPLTEPDIEIHSNHISVQKGFIEEVDCALSIFADEVNDEAEAAGNHVFFVEAQN